MYSSVVKEAYFCFLSFSSFTQYIQHWRFLFLLLFHFFFCIHIISTFRHKLLLFFIMCIKRRRRNKVYAVCVRHLLHRVPLYTPQMYEVLFFYWFLLSLSLIIIIFELAFLVETNFDLGSMSCQVSVTSFCRVQYNLYSDNILDLKNQNNKLLEAIESSAPTEMNIYALIVCCLYIVVYCGIIFPVKIAISSPKDIEYEAKKKKRIHTASDNCMVKMENFTLSKLVFRKDVGTHIECTTTQNKYTDMHWGRMKLPHCVEFCCVISTSYLHTCLCLFD